MTVFALKIIAIILMIVDHMGYFFPNLKYVVLLRMFGRLVAPIFFYLLVEGFIHTSNRKKYADRLLIFGSIMLVGNLIFELILITLNIPVVYNISPLSPNIFLTMFLGLIILGDLENLSNRNIKLYLREDKSIRKKELKSVIRLILSIIMITFTEYSIYALMMILVFYLFRNKSVLKWIVYMILSIVLCYIKGNVIQIFMIFAVFLLIFYNGEKGYSSNKSKYFFYLFYMIHIWLFAVISIFVN